MVSRKRPGIDKDIGKLGGGRQQTDPKLMGGRPGQWHSETLTAGHISAQPPRMHTVYGGLMSPGSRGAMGTLYGGRIAPGRGGAMDTIYGDPWSPGIGKAMDTIYGDPWSPGTGRALTAFQDANTAFGGQNQLHGRGPSQIVTRNIVHPSTRQPVTITYNQVTGLYLDQSLNRWLPAPPWISAQFRR
ncbi:hypothetical protein [Roseibium aggregatum]|uniref:Uncharacterized protein n=1 Tax=Roseibium aggregatum TaxID=187304 RepID=A0A939EFM0_9HYPH|nr:hypothetical protein [Roseibium aggregatum]MBN9672108.1 hypothetical protein [Roseibium aggregatum]